MADCHVTMGVKYDGSRCHIYPTWGRKHVLDGTSCWCDAEFSVVCSQCEGDGCWRCENGWVRTEIEADAMIVAHQI